MIILSLGIAYLVYIISGYTESLLSIYIGILTFLFLTIFNIVITPVFPTKEIEYEPQYIVSLNDGNEINGQFSLGSGYINSRLMYFYYKETQHGIERTGTPAENTYIKEGYEKPRIVHYDTKYLDTGIYSLFGWEGGITAQKRSKSFIYVPEGTVVKNIRLNNKNGN